MVSKCNRNLSKATKGCQKVNKGRFYHLTSASLKTVFDIFKPKSYSVVCWILVVLLKLNEV